MSETAAPEVDVKKLLSIVGPVIASTATGLIVNAALSAVKRASVTNSNKSTVAGDDEMHPTKKETSLAENDAAGTKTDSNMACGGFRNGGKGFHCRDDRFGGRSHGIPCESGCQRCGNQSNEDHVKKGMIWLINWNG